MRTIASLVALGLSLGIACSGASASSCAKTIHAVYATGATKISEASAAAFVSDLASARQIASPPGYVTVLYSAVASSAEASSSVARLSLAELREASLRALFIGAAVPVSNLVLTIEGEAEHEHYSKDVTAGYSEIVLLYGCVGPNGQP